MMLPGHRAIFPLPMASIGKQLNKAREEKDLSIEDVAFRTHIPAARLQELENDDFSNFANLTYAKGFLKLYSRFLEVDLSEYLAEFDTRDLASVTGHEYIQTARATNSLPQATVFEAPPRHGMWLLLGGVAAAIGITVYFFRSSGEEPKQSEPASGIAAGSEPAPAAAGPENAAPAAPVNVPPKAPVVPEDAESGGGDEAASARESKAADVEIRRAGAPSSVKAVVVDSSEEEEGEADEGKPAGGPATAGARP